MPETKKATPKNSLLRCFGVYAASFAFILGTGYTLDYIAKNKTDKSVKMQSHLEDITSKNIKEIEKGNVVIDVWAPWCGPCRRYEEPYKKIAESYKDKGMRFVRMEYDSNKNNIEDLVKKGNLSGEVDGIPCTLFMKDGKEVGRVLGEDTEEVKGWIEKIYFKKD